MRVRRRRREKKKFIVFSRRVGYTVGHSLNGKLVFPVPFTPLT
jgi:hypothetical protein